MQKAAITADHLTVRRGDRPILNELSFTVGAGMITGLIGPSGSGKTTLMRALIGAQRISDGRLDVLEQPAGDRSLRSRIGYVSQSPAVYDDLTVRQNLAYFAAVLGVSRQAVDRLLDQVDLTQQAQQLVATLSGGQRARVSLAVALLGDPDLLVLDEPTVGLDPVLRSHLWELFRSLAISGRTLIVSSHVMDEAERCDDLLLLRDGTLLSQGSRAALLKRTATADVEAAFLRLVKGANDA